MKKYLHLVIYSSFFLSTISFACEPASVDWDLIMKDYDLNKDQKISQHEFSHIQNFVPYEWPSSMQFQGKEGHAKLFKYLDQNNDGQLSQQELYEVYNLLPNPCAGWPWK
ncbi:EF-hand domain-containing protein [Acinetobacter gerneri]|uniref:EF-hand domain-containing protein n=1 Tax=Acinetobacter gerneri TaxID=202952 RepID=A0AAW8JF05_9GAMM|nr:EF-hand domain-containing protein [Acinetobacter gerneri]MDQ9009192.1 EF-hand domain-containing protein [Acinetobacter gerneri]MDQ9013296.1 EF-hand domain-containing protein [Acinetobacter gerneri]MDQ9023487.1 EF-hand domain-containing protein [Acinetobacter gerneri]MDQ9051968.1 EF-hand domain-containing protein [Acinetobacter gerneri]MDQ9059379.1 EF-hand domain-containing protein [Acinetobacter gerneri]